MRVLALDTTTRAGSVAIVEDDRVLIEREGDVKRSHAERLPTEVLAALEACDMHPADVDLFAIASGPGLFTGLRIGIATIQGFAFVTGKRVVSISALAALAEIASAGVGEGAVVAAWMDAHRRDVFSALYRTSGGTPFSTGHLVEVEAPAVGDPEETWRRWKQIGVVPEVLIGDGATLFADVVSGARILGFPLLASAIGRMAVARGRAGETIDPAAVQPLYVRRPDAELAREKVL